MNLPLSLGLRNGTRGDVKNPSTIYDATGTPWGMVFGIWNNTTMQEALKDSNQAARIHEAETFIAAVNEHSHCDECGGKGWMLNREVPQDVKIEACGTCNRFEDNGAAVEYVANRAGARREEL